MTEFLSERQVAVVIAGTAAATIFGPVPPQMSARIYSLRYNNPTGGTVTGYLQQFGTLAGYSPSSGTQNIDAITLGPGETESNDNGESVLTKVSPGNTVWLIATAGSLIARATYEYYYGRT